MYNTHGGYRGENSVVDYSININPLGVSDALKERLLSSIDELEKYPQIGAEESVKLLSEQLGLNREEIIVGNGATELIYLFSRALGIKQALVVEPTFTEYAKSVEIVGGKVHRHCLEKPYFKLDREALLKRAAEVSAEAVYICSPNNPTGGALEKRAVEDLLEGLEKLSATLFLDESFIEFSDRESSIDMARDHKLFVLRSVTKIYGVPGIRIGYGVGHRDIVEAMNKIKEPWSVNSMAIATLESYLEDEEYRERTESWYRGEKERFMDSLSGLPYLETYSSEANFVLCKLKAGSSTELQQHLGERGFYIRTCSDFYGLDESYIRLAVRRRKENEELLENMKMYRGGGELG
ncbi:threonine-phosphate decarboxylase [Andreesenia angusta]|uniref:Aminotransferase n=1 Tax=Andreesenia angusta TaxID=39480 RepID=A0A1S1V5H7_9FIRM|nr:histidinol-phosphate transaminase [Andreesenia angusta]OHW61832.1 threonine-phosphate decarboxylase [Andreesenia angusta]